MSKALDFASFYSSSTAERAEFCRQLVANLQQNGFVKLINHGVLPSDIDNAFETTRQFFQLPLEEKLKSPHPPTANPHRGFSPVGLENISTVSNYKSSAHMPFLKDMKESYDIGSERDPLYDNIWPPAGVHDSFKPTFTSFFSACYRAELAILDAISVGLELPENTLRQLHAAQTNELRLTHYPAVSRGDFANSTRIAAHTDFGTITLLFQDNVGGLQMEVPPGSGTFVPIDSGDPYECIINVGDCLQMWTGLHSARHRVHLPELPADKQTEQADDKVEERISIAYFGKPDRAASLRPLLGPVGPDKKYMTANDFQHMRIQSTY